MLEAGGGNEGGGNENEGPAMSFAALQAAFTGAQPLGLGDLVRGPFFCYFSHSCRSR